MIIICMLGNPKINDNLNTEYVFFAILTTKKKRLGYLISSTSCS